MNTEFFISQHLGKGGDNKKISSSILNISVSAIVLSVAIMLLSISILVGFKNEVTRKVIGFGAHISITGYSNNNSYELEPISKNQPFYPSLDTIQGIEHIQVVATKLGIIKTKNDLHGVVFKGVDGDYNWDFFKKQLVEGDVLEFDSTKIGNGIIISKKIADLLNLAVGDKMLMYFIRNNQPPSVRKLFIKGLYSTELEEFDKQFIFGDIRHIRKLNKWTDDQVSGFEIHINDFNRIEELSYMVYQKIALNYTEDATQLRVSSIRENYPQIFEWLELTNLNVVVILVIMIFVAVVNMITGVLIFILEQTKMIGLFKAMGATNLFIRKVFVYHAVRVSLKGLVLGDILGLVIAFIQINFNVVKLDPSSYYVSSVPIELNVAHILLLNVGTLLIIGVAMLIPSYLITKIHPSKAIKFN